MKGGLYLSTDFFSILIYLGQGISRPNEIKLNPRETTTKSPMLQTTPTAHLSTEYLLNDETNTKKPKNTRTCVKTELCEQLCEGAANMDRGLCLHSSRENELARTAMNNVCLLPSLLSLLPSTLPPPSLPSSLPCFTQPTIHPSIYGSKYQHPRSGKNPAQTPGDK